MSVYINEFDPRAAAWLRELMKRGLIADGVVDERSILDVRPDDLAGFTQCHFFGGIGGWLYAMRLAGWPDDEPVWTGSPPCQPFSSAGRQLGKDDERHLAPHFVSLVRACRPGVLFGEQVASSDVFGKAASGAGKQAARAPQWAWIDDLSDRLEAAHYAVGASDFPSAGIGAPHIRQRTFFGAVDVAGLEHAAGDGRAERGAEPSWRGASGRCGAIGLADLDSEGPLPGAQRGIYRSQEGSGSRHGEPERSGSAIGLGDSFGTGLEGQCRNGDRGDQPGRDNANAAGSTAAAGSVGCMANAERCQRRPRAVSGFPKTDGTQGRGASAEFAGDLCGCGVAGRNYRPDAPDSFWSNPDWIFCRDGKWRPVEPAVLGLADGLPAAMVPSGGIVSAAFPLAPKNSEGQRNRQMRLKGYGNAINPHAAAAFISAFSEAIMEAAE